MNGSQIAISIVILLTLALSSDSRFLGHPSLLLCNKNSNNNLLPLNVTNDTMEKTMDDNGIIINNDYGNYSSFKNLSYSLLSALNSDNNKKWVSLHHSCLTLSPYSDIINNSSNNTVEILDLTGNNFNTTSIRTISSLINSLLLLRTLVMDGCSLDITAVRLITKVLRKHASIRHIYFSSCNIDDESVTPIASLLGSNNNITVVDLSDNMITMDGFNKIIKALSSGNSKNKNKCNNKDNSSTLTSSSSCKVLDVSYNNIGDEGIELITTAIASNELPSLEHLILKQVGGSRMAIERLIKAVSEQSRIKFIDISGNPIFPMKNNKNSKTKGFALVTDSARKLEKSVATAMKSFGLSLTESYSDNLPANKNNKKYSNKNSKGKRKNNDMKVHKKEEASRARRNSILNPHRQFARAITSALKKRKQLTGIRLANVGLRDDFIDEFAQLYDNDKCYVDISMNNLLSISAARRMPRVTSDSLQ